MPERNLYTIGEIAAILGLSTHTIRAWERRHGIVWPERTHTKHRRYRGEDIELLREITRAIDLNGISLRLALQSVTGEVEPARSTRSQVGSQLSHSVISTGDASLWRAIGDVLPQLIMVIDENGTIADANVAVARVLGVVRQRVVGRKFVELVEPLDRGKASLLYRPQLRIVSSWELNIAANTGPRMYSFRSRMVRDNHTVRLAIVGWEMVPDPQPSVAVHGWGNVVNLPAPLRIRPLHLRID